MSAPKARSLAAIAEQTSQLSKFEALASGFGTQVEPGDDGYVEWLPSEEEDRNKVIMINGNLFFKTFIFSNTRGERKNIYCGRTMLEKQRR